MLSAPSRERICARVSPSVTSASIESAIYTFTGEHTAFLPSAPESSAGSAART